MTLECPRSKSLSRCGGSRGEGRQGKRTWEFGCRFNCFLFPVLDLLSDLFLSQTKKNRDDPRAFYALLIERTEELLPYVYMPTVGEVKKKMKRKREREIRERGGTKARCLIFF